MEETPDGAYRLTARVRQERVPESFQMIVPVYLDFGAAGDAQVNILVSGPETVVELPWLPMEPEEVVFKPLRVGARRRQHGALAGPAPAPAARLGSME